MSKKDDLFRGFSIENLRKIDPAALEVLAQYESSLRMQSEILWKDLKAHGHHPFVANYLTYASLIYRCADSGLLRYSAVQNLAQVTGALIAAYEDLEAELKMVRKRERALAEFIAEDED